MPSLGFDGLKEFKATENSTIASVESTTTASKAYNIGEYFWYAGKLYKATAPIASGATITIGTNCSLAPLANDVSALKSAIDATQTQIDVPVNIVRSRYINVEGVTTANSKRARTDPLDGSGTISAVNMSGDVYKYYVSYYDETCDISNGTGYDCRCRLVRRYRNTVRRSQELLWISDSCG